MCIQYFENELTKLKKKFCLNFTLSDEDTPDNFLVKLIKHFNVISGDENDFQTIKIVTPNEDLFSRALTVPFSRNNCVADAITKMLHETFKTTTLTDGSDTLSNCRGIVKYINSTEKHNLKIREDDGTWKGRISMVRSITENYVGILKILDEAIDLQFNKRKADEILSFKEPFVEAMDDLSSTSYTTANRILLWYALLKIIYKMTRIRT